MELLLFSSTLFFLLIVAGGAAYMTIGHGKIAVPDQYKWVIIMFYPGVFVSIVAIYRKLHRERFASEVKMNLVDIRLREHVKVTAASCAEEFESYCRGLAGRKDSAGKFTRMWNWNTVGKFTDRYASIIPGAFLSLVAWVTSIYFSLKWLNNLLYGSLAWKVLYVVGLLIVGSISVALFILGTFSTHYERDLLKMFSEKRREERDAALFDGKSSMVTS
ncbi:MAG: hypothetical protein HY924_02835 [Elusimicrobia bacterium]|nr:hypothetical protein [Elusimicrobiota bacterium]